ARHTQGHGAHVEPPVAAQGDHAVSGGKEQQGLDARAALARHAPHAHRCARTGQVRRVRPVPPDLPGELHQARAGRRRAGQPLSADLRDRRVPLRVLRLLPGGMPRGGDPRGRALRELGILAGPVRVRPRAAVRANAPRLDPVGSLRPEGRVAVDGTLIIFWAFAGLAIVSALSCITRRSPVASALWLVVTLFSLAALFVLLDAQFIAVLQVLVYAGAIMVLFLFVIMLLNLGRPGPTDLKGPAGLGVGVLLAGGLFVQLLGLARAAPSPGLVLPPGAVARAAAEQGMVPAVARPLFAAYLVPFEITSILLLTAIVGAVVLAKRML